MKPGFIILLLATALLLSCQEEDLIEKYNLTDSSPRIEFVDFDIIDESDDYETLLLTIDVYDLEFDLGLTRDDVNAPYNLFDYVRDDDGELISISSSPNLPRYSCDKYLILFGDFNEILDTVRIELNPNFNNIFVDFYIETAPESNIFEWFDFKSAFRQTNDRCGGDFNARFPIPQNGPNDTLFEMEIADEHKVRISYKMRSVGFSFLFQNKRFKVETSIKDRALNESNKITSPVTIFEQ
ncbi:MAG: hypothetical protein AAFQ94_04465 [Bacteroidota bacterium]